MDKILFLIGLFFVIIFAGSFLFILIEKKIKKWIKDFLKLQEAFKNAQIFIEKMVTINNDMINNVKEKNNKQFFELQLKNKLNKNKTLDKIKEAAIKKLMGTGLSLEDAKKYYEEHKF